MATIKTLGELLDLEDYTEIYSRREYYKDNIDLQIEMLKQAKRLYKRVTEFRGICDAIECARIIIANKHILQYPNIPNVLCKRAFARKYGNAKAYTWWWKRYTGRQSKNKNGDVIDFRNIKPRLAFLDWCIEVANAIKTEL